MLRYGLTTPVRAALGRWMVAFRADYQPDTAAAAEWKARSAPTAMAFPPGRMVDAVDAMLDSWRSNDNSGRAGTSAFLPMVFVAVARDYTEAPGEAGRPQLDRIPFVFPDDAKERVFEVRQISADIRAQVVVVASEIVTAGSIMGQLCLWEKRRRSFRSTFLWSGFESEWPIQVVQADRMAVDSPQGEHMAVLTLDLTLRAAMPLFYSPTGSEANDGQGTVGSESDPPGFPVVGQIDVLGHEPSLAPPAGVDAQQWREFIAGSAASSSDGPIGVVLHGLRQPTAFGG